MNDKKPFLTKEDFRETLIALPWITWGIIIVVLIVLFAGHSPWWGIKMGLYWQIKGNTDKTEVLREELERKERESTRRDQALFEVIRRVDRKFGDSVIE